MMPISERLNYWRNHDLKSGWTQSAGGPCCDKCRMTTAKDPLQALCGCRDPFQINCECHIPARRAFRDSMVRELEAISARPEALQKGETPRTKKLQAALIDAGCDLTYPACQALKLAGELENELAGLAAMYRASVKMVEETIPSPLRQKP